MREDAEQGHPEGESVDEAQHQLQAHNEVDQLRQEAFRDHRVLFDELREVVESRGLTPSKSA